MNAEVKTAQNKKDYAVLSIATSENWKSDKGEYETRTEWQRVGPRTRGIRRSAYSRTPRPSHND
jgi:hypothetical protein